jgi:transposase
MAISNTKILTYKIYETNINQNIYFNFLNDQLLPLIKNKYILMDNVGFHKTKNVLSLIDKSTNTSLFIPPYSPEFNPIENVFSIIKNNFRKLYISKETTINKINMSIAKSEIKFNCLYKSSLRNFNKNIQIFNDK